MCGICGMVYQDTSRRPLPEIIDAMCKTITHRGPDDQGVQIIGQEMSRSGSSSMVKYIIFRNCGRLFNSRVTPSEPTRIQKRWFTGMKAGVRICSNT